MSVPRFYFPSPAPRGGVFELPPEAARHASRVLRLRTGDPVQVFDGEGHAWGAVIQEISGKRVLLDQLAPCPEAPPLPLRIVLAQAMCSSEKMDWVVQKAVELGVAEIQPVQARRSVARLSGERVQRRAEHWRSVVVSACEQCGCNTLPQVHAPRELDEWLAQVKNETGARFILQPEGAIPLPERPRPQDRAILLVGPEGGFSADEVLMAEQAGFSPVLLGSRILRTETAALAGIAALQTLWGDFR